MGEQNKNERIAAIFDDQIGLFRAKEKFREAWDHLTEVVTETARRVGWDLDKYDPNTGLLLMHSEISEAVEALRVGNPQDKHCPQYDAVSVEMADLLIRLMVFAKMVPGIDIPGALIAKAEYNKTRPHKHGGKKF